MQYDGWQSGGVHRSRVFHLITAWSICPQENNVRLPIPTFPPPLPISGSVHAKLGVSECAPQYQEEKKNYAVVSFHFMIISDFYNI